MSSSGSVFGDLFGGKPAQTSQALTLRDFTIARTSSALQPVGDTDVEMVTPEKRIVKAPAFLSYMYFELHREIEHLGNIILELQRQERNPRHIALNICEPTNWPSSTNGSSTSVIRKSYAMRSAKTTFGSRQQANSSPAKSRWECSTWP